jgi:hypothetical protein
LSLFAGIFFCFEFVWKARQKDFNSIELKSKTKLNVAPRRGQWHPAWQAAGFTAVDLGIFASFHASCSPFILFAYLARQFLTQEPA